MHQLSGDNFLPAVSTRLTEQSHYSEVCCSLPRINLQLYDHLRIGMENNFSSLNQITLEEISIVLPEGPKACSVERISIAELVHADDDRQCRATIVCVENPRGHEGEADILLAARAGDGHHRHS